MLTAKKLFIIGCPRSGTTWVQLLLAQHPAVATAPETQIFAYYLDHFRRQWRHEQEGPASAHQGLSGLSRLLTDQEFLELCRTTADFVLQKIAASRPGAAVVAEKSPKHALEAEFIRAVLPDAYFLHVIRDPRDAAASLLDAGRSWAPWAPRNAIGAARLWRSCFDSARRVSSSEKYHELRYEDLRGNGSGKLIEIAEWLGLDWSPAAVDEAMRTCELSRLQKNTDPSVPTPAEKSPAGFFRAGRVGGWRKELTRSDVRVIEQICGTALTDAGYESIAGGRKSVRLLFHDGIHRVRESIDWQLEKLANKT